MVLLLAVLLLLATFSTKISDKLGVPGLVIFMGIGMLFGKGGLGLVEFSDPVLAQQIANMCLLFILFQGGFSTKQEVLKDAWVPSSLLATIGVIVTALVVGLGIYFILGIELAYALLIGSIISSTDAAAIFALLKGRVLKGSLRVTLESESASNDPMAIILTVAMIRLIQGQADTVVGMIVNLVGQLIVGVLVGALVAKIGVFLFNKLRLKEQSFYYVLALGVALLSYGLAELLYGNGFLSVFITGIIIGNTDYVFKRGMALFIEGVSTFSHVMLFLILGFLLIPQEAILVWKEGLIVALTLIFVARPIAVFLIVAFHKYDFRDKLFLSWAGIKGAVPVVLATYPLAAGLDMGSYIFNIVFFVVLISTTLQGSTIDWVAKKLGLFVGVRQQPTHSLELISMAEAQVEVIEYEVTSSSRAREEKINKLDLPDQTLVLSITRGNDLITPRGWTRIKEGDILIILVRYDERDLVLACLEEHNIDSAKLSMATSG